MFNRTCKLLLCAFALASLPAIAGDVKVSKCLRIFNALNQLEVKGSAPLEIIEFKIDKPIDYIFGENKLVMAPMKDKLKEAATIYRNPGVGRAILKKFFQETRLIIDHPPEDFASLLKPNTVYTYTIQDSKVTFAQTKPGTIRNFASKHAILSADKEAGPLRMAGEMWLDEKGILHFDPGSGTYKPGSADLARAERFFKEHLGIKNAVAHYFEAPANTVVTQANKQSNLLSQIRQIEAGQLAITGKRWIVSGSKMNVVSKARMKEMEVMENETITLVDPTGKEVKYKVARLETMVKEETLFDLEDFNLQKSGMAIISRQTYKLKEESKLIRPSSLNQKEQLAYAARNTGISTEKLMPIARKRSEFVQYGLYPVDAKGKTSQASFMITLGTKTTNGLANKYKGKTNENYEVEIEDLSHFQTARIKELNQLKEKLQKRFDLKDQIADPRAQNILLSLETNVGQ